MTSTQLALSLEHFPVLTRHDFLSDPSNEDALRWIDRYPNGPSTALIIYGEEGSGKTHLAHIFASKTKAPLFQASILTQKDLPDLLTSEALVLEDVEATLTNENALLHLFNMVKEQSKHLLLTANSPPNQWGIKLKDLSSRLATCTLVGLKSPNDTLMAAVIVKMFADRQLRIQQHVIDYLLQRMDRSFSTARRIVEKADELSLTSKRNITLPLLKEVLHCLS